jgi:hypothetical protein
MESIRRRARPLILIAAVALIMIAVAMWGDRTIASNMGFKINKQIVKGVNLISLPFRSQPLVTAKDICIAFGKTTAQTLVQQYPGPASYTCDQLTVGFPLKKKGVGIRLVETGSGANAILVGSHIDNEESPGIGIATPPGVTIDTSPFLYGPPYHGVSVNARDLCAEIGKTGVATVLIARYGPAGVVDGVYTCDQVASAGFTLRLGEALQFTGAIGTTFFPRHY